MKYFVNFFCGLLFAFGLGMSGMTQPHIVRGFLDVFGQWDLRLLGVMVGAIGVHAIAFRLIIKRTSPILDSTFHIPTQSKIDSRLILGAIIFGLGWGWAGICPGPGIVSLVSGKAPYVYFVISMLVGMKVFQLFNRKK
jgi:uncharacterized membrane protein YedE/YeeE